MVHFTDIKPIAGVCVCVLEGRLEKNCVAAFLLMIKNMLRNHPANQESLLQCHGPPIIGAMLGKVRAHTHTLVNGEGVWRSNSVFKA